MKSVRKTGREKIFVDTSGFFSLIAKHDTNYLKAINIWEKFQDVRKYILYTTEYVISETLTLTQSKLNKGISIKLGEYLLGSSILKVSHIDMILWKDSWEIYKKYKDKEFSFVDCTSFAFMKENKIKKAFTFDKHFVQFGFEMTK